MARAFGTSEQILKELHLSELETMFRWLLLLSILEIGLTATTRRADSQVRFFTEKKTVVMDVQSKFGIDHAVVKRSRDQWPEPFVVRLHLQGLESFKVTAGEDTVGWSADVMSD